jgi:uncharacterized membrane-anchored protein
MTRLADFLRRVPRVVWFIVAAVIQVALIAVIVVDRVRILEDGAEVTLETRPVDPRDFLRGDYVALAYEISTLPAGALKDQPSAGANAVVYVKLEPKEDGFYQAISVHAEPVEVTGKERLIQGRAVSGATCGRDRRAFCERLRIRYGIERYFVPQGEGLELERARNQGKVAVVVAVTPSGRAAIKRLLVDGKPVYEEPYF